MLWVFLFSFHDLEAWFEQKSINLKTVSSSLFLMWLQKVVMLLSSWGTLQWRTEQDKNNTNFSQIGLP